MTCSADVRSSSGFCATTPPAYAAAAARHSAAPQPASTPRSDVAAPDDDGARERDRAARDQRPREALAQQQAGEHGDDDRARVDEHRGRAGVDVVLGRVEDHVVGGEPQQAAEHEARHVGPRRERLAAHRDEQRRGTTLATTQAAERQRARGDLAARRRGCRRTPTPTAPRSRAPRRARGRPVAPRRAGATGRRRSSSRSWRHDATGATVRESPNRRRATIRGMDGEADIASVAAAIGHPARGRMLTAMLGGRVAAGDRPRPGGAGLALDGERAHRAAHRVRPRRGRAPRAPSVPPPRRRARRRGDRAARRDRAGAARALAAGEQPRHRPPCRAVLLRPPRGRARGRGRRRAVRGGRARPRAASSCARPTASRRSGSRSTRSAAAAGRSRARAWTGASAARTSRASWARRC